MNLHYVYIIYSESHDKYYKGYSLNPKRRLISHNLGASRYTSHFMPWKLIYIESFEEKGIALKREKGLKKYSKEQIQDLVKSKRNEM